MNLSHPALKYMITFGCKSQVKVLQAFQTYLELCEVHKAHEVLYKYCQELDIIYMIASSNEGEEIYVPVSKNDFLSPQKIKSYHKYLSQNPKGKGFNIVIRDIDTSCVIYKVSEGLETPVPPEVSKEKKDLKEKKILIETEISNLIPALIQEARSRQSEQ